MRWLVADNPARLNAFTAAMWAALPLRIAEAEQDPEVRVVVLTGAGDKAFSAGGDFDVVEEMIESFAASLRGYTYYED